VNLIRGLWRKECEMEWSQELFNRALIWAYGAFGYSQTWTYSSQGEIVRIMTRIHHEGRRNFRDQDVHKELYTVLVTYTWYSRLMIIISRLIVCIVDWSYKQRVRVSNFWQISWLIPMYSRLIDKTNWLIHWYSQLISGLTVFFSGSVSSFELDLSFFSSGAMIVRIDGVCIGLGESYGL